MSGFYEQLFHGVGDAIDDLREKVIEEPWFGRVVTERGEAEPWPEITEEKQQPPAFEGEVFGPESHSANVPDNSGLLDRGFILEGQAEEVPGWGSKMQQAEIAPPEPEQDREMER